MADCNHVMEGWEWDSIFSLEHDNGSSPWHGDIFAPHSTMLAAVNNSEGHISSISSLQSTQFHPSFASSLPVAHFPGTNNSVAIIPELKKGAEADSNNTLTLNTVNSSEASLESSDNNSHQEHAETIPGNLHGDVSIKKKKKRDPRLECPNFLAGRIPCACPEEDELEVDVEAEDVVKKKPKVSVRCQVPSCSEDISHLKGYHQRHKVCLGCANSPKVILKDMPHRYCQQCGKFHRLSDFDEGKRSCRRKLERHNKRRRRRPVEDETQDSGDPGHSNDNDQSAIAHEWNTAVSTKRNPPKKRNSQKRATHSKSQNKVVQSTPDSTNQSTEDRHTSDDSSTRPEQELICFDKAELDEPSLLTMLMEDNTGIEVANEIVKQSHHLVADTENMDMAMSGVKQLLSRASYNSTDQTKCVEYVSPYQTGRISFKLYDWNPADFPRRLRQQIFEWLANMPVELEGYIRSGCIVLTFFIAMPLVVWDKAMDDWSSYLENLFHLPGASVLGMAQISLPMRMKSTHIQGKLMKVDRKAKFAPQLLDIYPPTIEAGCDSNLYICGFNFSGANVFVSYGELYLKCSDCQPVTHNHFTAPASWGCIENLEIWKINVFCPDSESFGPAFVEVNTDIGISNFIPVLVADKYVCAEMNSFLFSIESVFVLKRAQDNNVGQRHSEPKLLKPQWCLDVLVDLGWTLRSMKRHFRFDRNEVKVAFTERLQGLLMFSSRHHLCIVHERLSQIALDVGKWSADTLHDSDVLVTKMFSSMNLNTHESHAATSLKGNDDDDSLINLSNRNQDLVFAKDFTVMDVEEKLPLLSANFEDRSWITWCRRPRNIMSSNNRRLWRIAVGTVSVATICGGMCFMLQHPHEVEEISMSFRRCLWGSNAHT